MARDLSINLYILALLASTSAPAAEFAWQSLEYPYRGEYSSPSAACESILTGVFSCPVRFVSLNRYSDKLWTCAVVDTRPNTGNSVQYRSIQRLGSECSLGSQFNTGTGLCESPNDAPDRKKNGYPPNLTCTPNPFKGNPVNVSNGNKLQVETDVDSSLIFKRYFNSIDGRWGHTYSMRLLIGDISLAVVKPDGRQVLFSRDGSTALAERDERGSLLKSVAGWKYSSDDGQIYDFDNAGQLVSWSQPDRPKQLIYHSGNKISITNETGETMTLVIDPSTYQVMSLSYNGSAIAYTYSDGRLTKATTTRQGGSISRIYHYESQEYPGALTGITNENGVRFATWKYDSAGRAITSEHANGAGRISVIYNNDGTSSVINEYGRITNYHFQQIQGARYISAIEGEPTPDCPYSNSSFTYDTQGLLKTRTDAKGNLTTYDYNDRGLETSRTEASGTAQARTIATEWHPTLFLKTKVTEPDRITTYQYDAQGRQIGQTVIPR